MEILKDSRQIPKKKIYTANKLYSDIVYTWLQVNSEWDVNNEIRWVPKQRVNFTLMGEQLGLSRQPVSTRFKKLLDDDGKQNKGLGLVHFNSKLKRYELVTLESDAAMLVERETLRKMLSAFNENTISVYVYLLNRYIANKEQGYEFTLEQVKSFIGISVGIRSNNYIITDIMDILKQLGLLDYQLVEKFDRACYQVISMSNKIPKTQRC